MEESQASDIFSALGHPRRVALLRRLIAAQRDGVAAGALAEGLALPPSTLSHHLAALEKVGLIAAERRQRHIYYSVAPDMLAALVAFLVDDCCGGRPDLCGLPA